MGRGAPNKPGLTYFPKMLDFYEDDRIFDLLDEYGPLGVTVYDCILCIVYKHGYYAEIPLDKLSKMIVKMIGNKWVKSQKAVVQVVHFCSEIGLLDDDLMTKNIITSVGIQRRYYEIAVKRMKRQLYSDKYWLLNKEENAEPLLTVQKNQISSEVNRINSEENRITSEESAQKEKENKNIHTTAFPPELEIEFQRYLRIRANHHGDIGQEQIQALRDTLLSLSSDINEQISIVQQSASGGYRSLFPVDGRKKKESKQTKKKNDFNNFQGREYTDEQMKGLIQM